MKEDKSYYYGSTKPTISLEINEISKKEKISIIEIIIFCISIIGFILVFIKSEIFLLGLILSASSLIISLSTLIVSYFLEKKEHKYYKLAFWISFLAVILGIFFLIVYNGEDKRCQNNVNQAVLAREVEIINDIIMKDAKEKNYKQKCYDLNEIEQISKATFSYSPYEEFYTSDSYAYIFNDEKKPNTKICLIDESGKGAYLDGEVDFYRIETTKKCTIPKECK